MAATAGSGAVEEAGEQLVHLVDEHLHTVLVLSEPLEVQAVRPDLAAARGGAVAEEIPFVGG
jgi:hypothetical protein